MKTTANQTPGIDASTGLNEAMIRRRSPMRWRHLRKAGKAIPAPFSIGIVAAFAIMALLAPWLAPYDPLTPTAGQEFLSPTTSHLLGTDAIGRDILSRIMYGARISLTVGCLAVLVGAAVGGLSGMVAGLVGGKVGALIMRLWDALFAISPVLLGLALAALLQPGATTVGVAICIASAPVFARIGRAAVIKELSQGYILANRAIGMRSSRIFFVHLFPNVLPLIVIQVAIAMAEAILLESALSFLGLGPQPPAATWGAMVADARGYLYDAWWYAFFPGLAISLLVLALLSIGDSLRDRFDPTTSGRR